MKITPRLAAKLARNWAYRRFRRRTVPHGLVLLYHRVAAPAIDPWSLCVSPEHFAGQIRELCAMADVVPLAELPARLRAGRRTRPVVAVTFDDAYLDNLTDARPVLAAHAAPATVFVPTGWVGSPDPVWWDLLAHVVLATPQLPDVVELDGPHLTINWRNSAPAARRSLHLDLWAQLRRLSDETRRVAMRSLLALFGTDATAVRDARVMTPAELESLTRDGLVTLGSHAVSHPSLPGLDAAEKAWEIEESARQFEALTGQRPTTFAFPYGDVDQASVALLAASGYRLACSTREDLVWPDSDPLLLPRLAVSNWNPREFRIRLQRYWLA